MRGAFTYEGKRYYVSGKDKVEVEVNKRLKLTELEKGIKKIDRTMLVKDWINEWFDTYKSDVNTAWKSDIQGMVKNRINPAIGNMQIKNIKPIHLDKILNGCSNMSESYVHKIYTLLREIFKKAYANNLISTNPAADISKPKAKASSARRSLTEAERSVVLKVAEKHRGGLFILIMLYCGLRPQEIAALQWKDIKDGYIHINKALKRSGTIEHSTKTKAGTRKVPIPEALEKKLKKSYSSPFDYVCTQTDGKSHHTKSSIRKMWLSFLKEMNIEMGCKTYRGAPVPPLRVADDLVLYCLRHTYCTDLQNAGVPINVARELMGHEDISTTSKIYTHSSDASLEKAKSLLNSYVAGGVAGTSEHIEKSTKTP